MKNLIVAVVATAVIIGGGAFYGGMQYAKSASSSSWNGGQNLRNLSPEQRQQRAGQIGVPGIMGGVGARGGSGAGGVVTGEVLTKDATSMTVKLRDGGSKIVIFSSSAEIGKFVSGTIEDVSVGQSVIVSGKANADGSVTAQSIQIRPVSTTQTAPATK